MPDVFAPKGWMVEPLSRCVEVLDWQRKPVNSKERASRVGAIPYYGATGQVGWIDDYLFDEQLVLVGEDGAPFLDKSKPIAYLIEGKSWVNNHAHVLRARGHVTSNRYIKYYLDSFDFTDYVQGSTRDKLTQGAMNSIPIPLPPRPLQDAIVDVLDGLAQKRGSARAHLAIAGRSIERSRQAILAAACAGRLTADWRKDVAEADGTRSILEVATQERRRFYGRRYSDPPLIDTSELAEIPDSWTWTSLASLMRSGPQNGLYLPQSKYGSGTPILRIEDYQLNWSRSSSELKRVNASSSDCERYALNDSDIVINRVNSPSHLGKAILVQERNLPALFESNMMRISLVSAVEPTYVVLFLQSMYGRQLLTKNAKWAVNQASINQGDVNSTPIPLPPIDEQQEIVRRALVLLAIIDQLLPMVESAAAKVGRSSQAVLAKAFRGELLQGDPIRPLEIV